MALSESWDDEATFMDTHRVANALQTGGHKHTSALGSLLSIFGAAPKSELSDKDLPERAGQQASDYKFLDPFDESVVSAFAEENFEQDGITFVIIKNVADSI